jgi:glycosyltransferase involved in cell wall biosynthesis
MSGRILVDLSHTSHTAARTGVQRVALGLERELGAAGLAITYDPYACEWRELKDWERAQLGEPPKLSQKRAAQWPWTARWAGRVRRLTRPTVHARRGLPESVGSIPPDPWWASARGMIQPEIFSPEAAAALPELFARVSGPKVALFHDAAALRMPELAPPRTVARFPAYLRELAQFDGIAAISEASRAELLGYWEWAGIRDTPPVVAISPGVERGEAAQNEEGRAGAPGGRVPPRGDLPTILCVGSIEGRKNHLALLQACELLWSRGLRFELQLIGLVQRQTGMAAAALIQRLQAAGRPIRYEGAAGDAAREAAYAAAAFTVYPSVAEGFGLPVAESLIRGKVCVCAGTGALGEISLGGGCQTVADPTPEALAEACAGLLLDPVKLDRLTTEARGRTFPTAADYARRLVEWMQTLG